MDSRQSTDCFACKIHDIGFDIYGISRACVHWQCLMRSKGLALPSAYGLLLLKRWVSDSSLYFRKLTYMHADWDRTPCIGLVELTSKWMAAIQLRGFLFGFNFWGRAGQGFCCWSQYIGQRIRQLFLHHLVTAGLGLEEISLRLAGVRRGKNPLLSGDGMFRPFASFQSTFPMTPFSLLKIAINKLNCRDGSDCPSQNWFPLL